MAKDLEEVKNNIARNVKKYRKAAGYTQKDLCVQANLNELYISQIERAVAIPSIPALFRIAEVLGKDISLFFAE